MSAVAGLTPRKHRINEASQESGSALRVGYGDPLGQAVEQLGCECMLLGKYAGSLKVAISDQQCRTQRYVASPVR